MWRPELNPLPCRESFTLIVGADGRQIFRVIEDIPSGTVLEISLCVEIWVTVVDQFPYLWDFVLTGEIDPEYAGCQHTSASSCVFVDQDEGNIGERAKRVLYFIYPLTLSQCPNP